MNKKSVYVLGGLVVILLVVLVAETAYFLGQKNQSVGNAEKSGVVRQDKSMGKNKSEGADTGNKISSKGKSGDVVGEEGGRLGGNSDKRFNSNEQVGDLMNDGWYWYVNEDAGFKIKLPKQTSLDGKKYYQVKTFKDGPITFISSSEAMEKEILRRKNNKSMSVYDKVRGVSFAILVERAESKKDLEQFIKNRYDEECELGDMEKTANPGIFEVGIKGGTEPGEGCFINYMTVVKYSPEKKMVAAWDIGQAPNFWIDGKTGPVNNAKSFDMIISDSFEFLK